MSVFSAESLLCHLGCGLLLAAVLFARARRTRALILAGAIALALSAAAAPAERLLMSWMIVIAAAAAASLLFSFTQQGMARFSDDDAVLRKALFTAVPPKPARHLIDQGWWFDAGAGEVIAHEGQPVDALVYLLSGSARVTVGGRDVGRCSAGDLVGEATVLDTGAATATVTVDAKSRLWCIKATDLRAYVAANPDLRAELEHSFRDALRAKLAKTNAAMAAVGAA